jgi:hypothetical protein
MPNRFGSIDWTASSVNANSPGRPRQTLKSIERMRFRWPASFPVFVIVFIELLSWFPKPGLVSVFFFLYPQ